MVYFNMSIYPQFPDNIYDIIIIGGGPAGLTAGLYASRASMKTLLIEKMGCGGNAALTDWIENYPSMPDGISGFELAQKMEQQTRKFGTEIVYEKFIEVKNNGAYKIVKTTEKEYNAIAVIIATGAEYKSLGVLGENEFRGKGVSYCATCDGAFFKDKDVVVVGGGNSAFQEAIFLTRFAKTVTIVHRRDTFRATSILQERAKADPKIRFIVNSIVERIEGNGKVERIILKDSITNQPNVLHADGIFVFVGFAPATEFIKGVIDLDDTGNIITDVTMNTSSNGIFACGDARKKTLRQVVTAAGDGAIAAHSAQEYVEQIKNQNLAVQ